jgi:hypothetical protein
MKCQDCRELQEQDPYSRCERCANYEPEYDPNEEYF